MMVTNKMHNYKNQKEDRKTITIAIPKAIESEQAVLGILLIDENAFWKIADIINANDFYAVFHQDLYQCITALAKQGLPFDVLTVGEKLSKNPALGKTENEMLSCLTDIAKKALAPANVHHYASRVKELARRRNIIEVESNFLQKVAESESDIDSILEENIQALAGKMAASSDSSMPRLNAVTLSDFFALDLKPKEMILSPWMATQSLSMLHAPRGVGKTFLSLNIACAISSGGGVLNWKASQPRGVLIIDGEMPANSLQERMARLITSNDKQIAASFKIITPDLQKYGMPDLATYEGQRWVNQHITDDVELIIVDNISTLVRTGRENDAESWLPVQGWALNLRAKGKSVLFIHHSSKGGGQRGSSRKEDVLDNVIALRRPEGYSQDQGACFEIHFEKARGFHGEEAKPILVQLQNQHGKQSWIVKPLEASTSEKVLQLYQEGYSQKKIAEELDINKSTVYRHINRANSTGISNYANGGTA